MKATLVSTALATVLSVSSGFENHAEEQNERRLRWGWDKGAVFLKYKGINDRCCGEDLTECEFKFRSWKLFGLKDKWDHWCETSIPEKSSVNAFIFAEDKFSTLATALEATGLDETLKDPDSTFTVFAPNDAAFDNLPEGTLDTLLGEEGLDLLTNILLLHVIDGAEILSTGLPNSDTQLTTAGGDVVSFTTSPLAINDAAIGTDLDNEASNGVVHEMDGVILPSL